jgi:anti-sigma factor RsiW
MRCEDLVGVIIDYVEGTMDPLLREEFDRHMGDCESCLAFFKTYEKTRELTKETACDDLPQEIQSRVKDFLKKNISAH